MARSGHTFLFTKLNGPNRSRHSNLNDTTALVATSTDRKALWIAIRKKIVFSFASSNHTGYSVIRVESKTSAQRGSGDEGDVQENDACNSSVRAGDHVGDGAVEPHGGWAGDVSHQEHYSERSELG